MIKLIKIGVIVSIGIMFLSACVTHKSPLQQPEGDQPLYLIQNEKDAFRAAYDALSEVIPNYPVQELDGPVRGYFVVRQPAISRYTTMVRVFPGVGTTSKGEIVQGYYAEVSGRGDVFDGPSFDEKVYDLVTSKLSVIGTMTQVSKLERGKYQLDRDRWRLTKQPSLRDGGNITIKNLPTSSTTQSKSVTQRLEELGDLKTKGMVTNEEYKYLRIEILKGL